MKTPIRVRDIMHRDLLCLSPETEINAALRALLSKEVSGAPVVDSHGNLIGVLSQKDCIRAALDAHYHHVWGGPVSSYMSNPVETLEPTMALVNAAHFFTNSQYRRFPVVENARLVGQVSRRDVLEALLDSWQ